MLVRIIAILACGILLPACKPRSSEAKLVGTWRAKYTNGAFLDVMLSADHTARLESSEDGKTVSAVKAGTWRVTGDQFFIHWQGEGEYPSTIVSVDHHTLAMRASIDGQIHSVTRVK